MLEVRDESPHSRPIQPATEDEGGVERRHDHAPVAREFPCRAPPSSSGIPSARSPPERRSRRGRRSLRGGVPRGHV